jgi:20S proteasome alpha/beta subunit
VEYAIEAIKLGSTAIGIQTDEGVILAVEKRITSPLMEPTSIEKVRQRGQVASSVLGSGLDPDSIRSVDPYPDSESRSGSRREKMTHKSRTKLRHFMWSSKPGSGIT